ncbi:transcriptional repressor [Rhodococcus sp. Z13]|uniref:Transcriptional repressor n=1 Tax=Rhodococcus sacchari TaxID=2962047 RepID=A0ACD4DH95_9NOCA|nr:Fur family transcriptional regulator [Rhodococcus sp. Z13]UYP19063.1 transcriptional repressor [Rhodococcus sp. Z13]
MAPTSEYAARLRTAALYVTRPRVAVLEAVDGHPHADTDTILVAVQERIPGVSRQTVYSALHALTVAGLIRRIQPAGLVARYESRVGDDHHHLVCRACGSITDVDRAVGRSDCLATPQEDFLVERAEVVYWGLCPACSAPE